MWDDAISLLVGLNGKFLRFGSHNLRDNQGIVLKAIRKGGRSLRFASNRLQSNREIVTAAVNNKGTALEFACDSLKDDEGIVRLAVANDGASLRFASSQLQRNEDLIQQAVTQCPKYVNHLSEQQKGDKEMMLVVLKANGMCLKNASRRLRGDKDYVLAAAKMSPAALKFALDGLNQNPDCLVAAGIWDAERYDKENQRPIIVLSTRFSLDEGSSSTATDFTVLLKRNPYIKTERKFNVYSPNAFDKKSCDPNWTDSDWPCRGTFETCQMEESLKGDPTDASCWRYSFRNKLEKAARNKNGGSSTGRGGCMIQVVEFLKTDSPGKHGGHYELGKGQGIELEMAQDVGTKVFQIYQPTKLAMSFKDSPPTKSKPLYFSPQDINKFVEEQLKPWYEGDCTDSDQVRDSEQVRVRNYIDSLGFLHQY